MQNATAATELTLQQLKPIKMLLVKMMPDNKAQYLACTAAGAEYYSFLLNNNLVKRKISSVCTHDNGW